MSSWNWQADKDDVSSAAACFGALKHPRKMLLSDPSGSDLTGVPFSICYPFDSSFYLRSVSKTQPILCVKKQWDLHRMTWMRTKDARPNDNGLNNKRLYNNVLNEGRSNEGGSNEGGSNEDYPTKTIQRWRRTIGMTDDCPYDNQKVPHSTGTPNQLPSSQLVYYVGSDVPSAIGLVHLDLIFMWNLQLVALALRI